MLRQLPLTTAGPVNQTVGFQVTDEFIFLRVPLQFAAQLVAEISEAADN